MNPNDEATGLINTWLRGCETDVQLSVADQQRLSTNVAHALAQRDTWAEAADRLAVAVEVYQTAQCAPQHHRPTVYLAAYNLALALEQFRRWRPGSEDVIEVVMRNLGRYQVGEGLGGNG